MRRYLKVDIPKAIREFEFAIRRLMTTRLIGQYQSIVRGKGLEFDGYVPYTITDDASRIDWKASARANELIMKQFIEERDIQVFFLIDVSNSMVFGSAPKLKNEFTVEMVAALANFMITRRDRVGFALFNDKVFKERLPGYGGRQLYALTRTLLDPYIYGGRYDLDSVLKFLAATLPESVSLLMIFSDFIGPRNLAASLKVLSRKIETIAVIISDPRDKVLPATPQSIVLEDPYSEKTLLVDPSLIKNLYEKYAKAQEKQLEEMFKEAKVDFVKISTEKSFTGPMIDFFKRRAKRICR
jgi:uncharacterized protein (DUF58 family)